MVHGDALNPSAMYPLSCSYLPRTFHGSIPQALPSDYDPGRIRSDPLLSETLYGFWPLLGYRYEQLLNPRLHNPPFLLCICLLTFKLT